MERIGYLEPENYAIEHYQSDQTDLIHRSETGLGKGDHHHIEVTKDERYTKINIDKEVTGTNLYGKETKTIIRTEITKDNHIDAKETHIKKVFISKNDNDTQDVIVREIYVDHLSGKKVSNDRKVAFNLESDALVNDALGRILCENVDATDRIERRPKMLVSASA